ncbi:small GTP-binding protein [Tritrichomonas foetus]|uniref:Small GTP-binding protein n=1 Tax=Tritrichomonas foetus TaxID=1144522 RepID=A0A1J4JSH7_9EUKA|nr:small GTP-binding protein [Tritrichomonas foetus]|eukprot:OHT02057.1 small GTP-binding protein [Tritrichomonas foetus]
MSETLSSVKLVLLGDSGVGKTSIVTQYVSGVAANNVKPTIGAAFVTKEVIVDGKPLELLIWDTAGQEVYRGLAPMYYRSALIAIVVYDVTRTQSYEAVNYWIKELKTNVDGSIIILVCGNKTDLEDKRAVESAAAQAMADSEGALYAETSASTGAGIERMFQLAVSKLLSTRKNNTDSTPSSGVNLNDGNETKSNKCC